MIGRYLASLVMDKNLPVGTCALIACGLCFVAGVTVSLTWAAIGAVLLLLWVWLLLAMDAEICRRMNGGRR